MRYLKMIALILCCTVFIGCWDKVEIDRKLFVSTIGIDVGKDISNEKELKNIGPNDPFGEFGMRKLKIIYGFPDISGLSPGKGGTAEEKSLSVDAYSMEDAFNKSAAKSSRSILYAHTKLLLLSSNLLAYPNTVKEIVDYFQRDAALNKVMHVVVAEGDIESFIKYQPVTEKNIESYISGVMENSAVNANVLPITFNEFLIMLSENGNAVLPKLTFDKDKKEVKVSGVSVIKNYAIKGDLNPVETSDIELLRGKLKGGKKVIFKEGHPIDLSIEGLDRRITVDRREGKLRFNIYLNLEGQIKGYYLGEEFLDSKTLADIESNFNNSIKEETQKVIKRTQNEFGVDPIGLREYVEKYHPIIWNEIKDNWEQGLKNAEIEVNVNTKIRRIGAAK